MTKSGKTLHTFTILASIFLPLISLFAIAIIGAGGHGHMGLHSQGDSFDIYMISYLCLVAVAGFNFFNQRNNFDQSSFYLFFNQLFIGIIFVIGIAILISTIHEDQMASFHNKDRIVSWDYLKILVPIGILTIMGISYIPERFYS